MIATEHTEDSATEGTEITKTFWISVISVISVAMFSVCSVAAQTETIAEILVHGNHTTPTADILALAALTVGEPATPERLAAAEERLRASGRFEAIEVRRRYRSIADPSEILIVVIVNERGRPVPMLLPIVAKRDGHALTYGGRVTFADSFGTGTRISVPATWGGERRAAVEIDKMGIRGTVAVQRQINPHFEVADERREVRLQAEHALRPWLRAGIGGRLSHVTFGGVRDRVAATGAHVTVDTRTDAGFPRNAVRATFAVSRLKPAPTSRLKAALTFDADMRGYIGVAGPLVLAVRGHGRHAGSALPISEWALVGGSDSVRGYRAGHRAGDSMSVISAELRLPLTSPLTTGRFGVKAFVDAGAAWKSGERLRKQQFDRGVGGGVYFGVAVFSASADVAFPERGGPRLHVQFGILNQEL